MRRLRCLAKDVIAKYPIGKYKLNFINHGENATFKVVTSKKEYLLRIHRNGYHTKMAILEELKWLKKLSETTDIPVQQPLHSTSGKLLELQSINGVPDRHCSLLQWQQGRIRFRKLTPKMFYKVGELTAQLHQSSQRRNVKHRNYWTLDGLLGQKATWGSLSDLKDVIPRDYPDLEKFRKMIYSKLSQYQKRHPNRLSLIHADLHFGNMLWNHGEIAPIDFDDCGWGFHLYDLAVTFCALSATFTNRKQKKKEWPPKLS